MKIVIVCVICSLASLALGMYAENVRHDCKALDLYLLTPEWVEDFAGQEVYYVSYSKDRIYHSPVGQFIAQKWDWMNHRLDGRFYLSEDSAKAALCVELHLLQKDLECKIGDLDCGGKEKK